MAWHQDDHPPANPGASKRRYRVRIGEEYAVLNTLDDTVISTHKDITHALAVAHALNDGTLIPPNTDA